MNASKIWVALGLIGLCASPAAMAAEGWYAGVGAGQSSARYDYAGMAANAGTTLVGTKPHDTAYNVFAGYMLNNYMGFEGSYFNLGKFGIDTAAGLGGTSKVDGFTIDWLSLIPITQKFDFEVKLGGNYASTRDSFPGAPIPSASKNEGLNMHMALGVQYAITDSVDVRGEINKYMVNDGFNSRSLINTYTVSLVFPLQ